MVRRPAQPLRLAAVAWFAGLLGLPLAAYVAGARQPDLEATPKPPLPPLTRASVTAPETYAALDAAILARLPLRDDALQLRGEVALRLFDESTNADVIPGRDGWLFYDRTFQACGDRAPRVDTADATEIMARTLSASGRRAAVMITGSKAVARRAEVVGVPEPTLDCVQALEQSVQARLARTPGGLDISGELAARRAAGMPVFRKNDTHWNGIGQLVYVRAVLDRLQPGLAAAAGVRRIDDPVRAEGDLARLAGVKRSSELRPPYASQDPPRTPTGVVLVGDSQTAESMYEPQGGRPPIADVALPGATRCTWPQFDGGVCDDAMRASKAVLLQRVGRNVDEMGASCWRVVSLTAPGLPERAARWAAPEGQPALADGRTLAVSGQVTARITAPSGDVTSYPRLLRIPIRTLGTTPFQGQEQPQVTMVQQPLAGGQAVPCATPLQRAPTGSLYLPVPAGRSVASLQVLLQAPAETVLGTPQEIRLDDRRTGAGRR